MSDDIVINENNDDSRDSRLDYSKVGSFLIDDEGGGDYENADLLSHRSKSNDPPLLSPGESKRDEQQQQRGLSAELYEMLDQDSRVKIDQKFHEHSRLSASDLDYVRSTPLFDFWDEATFQKILREDFITFKRFRYLNLCS